MPSPAAYLGSAADVKIVGDECGFELHITTDTGHKAIVNVHSILGQLLEEVTREITAYLNEGEDARASRPVPDDADAYDVNDPKHPGWSVGV